MNRHEVGASSLRAPLGARDDWERLVWDSEQQRRPQPHKCPLCNGEGDVPWFKGTDDLGKAAIDCNVGRKPCYGCNGKGIVWEPV